MRTAKDTISDWLHAARITVNGNKPYDIQIHDERFYDRVLAEGHTCFRWFLPELIYRNVIYSIDFG